MSSSTRERQKSEVDALRAHVPDLAELRVPGNASAAHASLLLAPEWLFSHFPYGAFFPSYVQCHADSWKWPDATALEQRLCMPNFRVPVVMVHMAGLRNGQWGRRGVMRALAGLRGVTRLTLPPRLRGVWRCSLVPNLTLVGPIGPRRKGTVRASYRTTRRTHGFHTEHEKWIRTQDIGWTSTVTALTNDLGACPTSHETTGSTKPSTKRSASMNDFVNRFCDKPVLTLRQRGHLRDGHPQQT